MGRQLPAVFSDRRGASEVVGIVLLFGLVLVGATFIFAMGSSTLNAAESQVQLETAEQSIETLNTELKTVSSKQENATTDLQLRSSEVNDVRVRNETSIFIRANYSSAEDYETETIENVRSIVYTHDDGTRIISQAGGVWRVGASGTTTVTPPPLEYRDGALFFSILKPTGSVDPTDGTVRVRRDGFRSRQTTEALYDELIRTGPGGQTILPNNITIDVQGPNSAAWQQHFENEYTDDRDVTVGPEQTTFELISSVEAGTPTEETAYSVTEFANQPSKHVFEHTIEDGLTGNLSTITVSYEGNVDLSGLADSPPEQVIQSIGLDTTGDGFLDTTAGVAAIDELELTDSRTVRIELETDSDEPRLPISQGDTFTLRYGTLEDGSVTNPPTAADDDVTISLADDRGNSPPPIDGSLDLTPELDPISTDDGELVIRGENITVENANTVFERKSTEAGERIPVDVVIVSDQSGSMNDNDPTGLRPDATDAFIDKLANSPPNDRVATVHFSAKCFADSNDSKVIEPLQNASQVQADFQPRDERASCNTNYHAGFRTAVNVLQRRNETAKQDRNAAIVFMGDGGHNADEVEYDSTDEYEFDEFPSEANIRELAEEASSRNITVHTIGFSEGIDDEAEQLLENMAAETGGTTQFPEQASDLEDTFEAVADDVTEPSFFLDREPVSVTARINGNSYTVDSDGTALQPGAGTASTNEPLYNPKETLARQAVPATEVPSAQEIRNGESVRLALTVNEHGCDEDGTFDGPFNPEIIGGEKYTRRLCEPVDGTDPVRTIAPGDSQYFVLTNGTTLDGDKEAAAWQQSVDAALADAGVTSGGELALSDREAVIVARVDNEDAVGYAAFVVRTTPVELAYEDVVEPGNRRLFSITVQEVELDE